VTSSSSIRVDFRLATDLERDGIAIEAGRLHWVGPLAPPSTSTQASAANRTLRRFALDVVDSHAVGNAVDWVIEHIRELPLCPAAFLDLAAWWWTTDPSTARAIADGRRTVDRCLELALLERDPEPSDVPSVEIVRDVVVRLEAPGSYVGSVRRRRDGRLAFVTSASNGGDVHLCVHGAEGTATCGVPAGERLVFVEAIGDADGVYATYDFATKRCVVFGSSVTGPFEPRFETTLPSLPTHTFVVEGLRFIHCQGESVGVPVESNGTTRRGGDELRIPQPPPGFTSAERPYCVGRFVTGASMAIDERGRPTPRTLRWFDVHATSEPIDIGCAGSPPCVRVVGDVAWLSSTGALHRARGGEPAEVVAKGIFWGIAIRGDEIFLGETSGTDCFVSRRSLVDCRVLARGPVNSLPWELVTTPRGVLAFDSSRWTYLSDDGVVLASSLARRQTSIVRLEDRTIVAAAGEELIVLAPDGTIVRRRMMPHDGAIVGRVGGYAVYAMASGGWERVRPAAIYFVDADGAIAGRYEFEIDSPPFIETRVTWENGERAVRAVIDADAIVASTTRAGAVEVVRLHPVPATGKRAVHSAGWVEPPRFEQRVDRGATYDPRDDWKEPGLAASGLAVVAVDSSFRGSTGVFEASAIEARDGAVVVLDRCDLPDGGIEINGDAVVILVDCSIGTKPVSPGGTGRIFRFDTKREGSGPGLA